MANQRAKDKVNIGAWVDEVIADGIAAWLEDHPGMNQTTFLLAAILEKLEREGFSFNRALVLRDRRIPPRSEKTIANINYLRREREKRLGKEGKQ